MKSIQSGCARVKFRIEAAVNKETHRVPHIDIAIRLAEPVKVAIDLRAVLRDRLASDSSSLQKPRRSP